MPADHDRESKSLNTATKEPKSPDPSNEPFPLKWVLLAALIPALFGVSVGLFILPPRMGFDPAAGLLTWMNFIKGGTWNTIPVPDPSDISQTIEVAVTWWPPGQYLFLGLLNLAGLSFGHAALLLAFLSTLSGAIGLAVLGKELGATTRALPWIAAALACSQYNLINYNTFSGGEVLIMAIWPWVAITAWRLRDNSKLLICTLPILFLIGSFIKYSFAIYALCILLFLWSERLINLNLKTSIGPSERAKDILTISIPLGVIGIAYLAGRHYLTNIEPSPLQESELYIFSLNEILAYCPISPLTSSFNSKQVLINQVAKALHRNYDEIWSQLASVLAFLSPVVIVLYIFFIGKRQPLLRFIGVTALTTVLILATLHLRKASISLEDRHYQQAGSLLIAAITSYAFNRKRFSRLVLFFIIGTMAFNTTRTSWSILNVIKNHTPIYVGKDNLTIRYPSPVLEKLKSITLRSKNSVITVPYPDIILELESTRHSSTRLLPTYRHGLEIASNYKGRTNQITITAPSDIHGLNFGRELKSRFADYTEDEWTSYEIGGWTFWQTGYSEETETEGTTNADLSSTAE